MGAEVEQRRPGIPTPELAALGAFFPWSMLVIAGHGAAPLVLFIKVAPLLFGTALTAQIALLVATSLARSFAASLAFRWMNLLIGAGLACVVLSRTEQMWLVSCLFGLIAGALGAGAALLIELARAIDADA